MSNAKVRILDSKGVTVGTAFTNADGHYLFNYKHGPLIYKASDNALMLIRINTTDISEE